MSSTTKVRNPAPPALGDLTYTYAKLVLADGGTIRYDRISSGAGFADAVMEHTATPTAYYKSRLTWNAARGGWDLTFRDGTVWEFVVANPGSLLTAIRDRHGNRLTITRGLDHYQRQIAQVTSPSGRWVKSVSGQPTVTYAYL